MHGPAFAWERLLVEGVRDARVHRQEVDVVQREHVAAVDEPAQRDADVYQEPSVKAVLVLLLEHPHPDARDSLDAFEPAADVRGEALGLARGAPRALAVRDDDAERRGRGGFRRDGCDGGGGWGGLGRGGGAAREAVPRRAIARDGDVQGDERGYAQERDEGARDVLTHGEGAARARLVSVTCVCCRRRQSCLALIRQSGSLAVWGWARTERRRSFLFPPPPPPFSEAHITGRAPPHVSTRGANRAMGQQSQSGRARTKRAPIPNSPAVRKAIKKAAADKKEKTIVRSYAEKKRLKQERAARFENVKHENNTNFGSEGMKLKAEAKGPMEVRYRALAKKLRQIQELEAKKKEGASLDQWQLAKLRKKPFVKAEIRALARAVGGDGAGEEDGSEDSGSEDDADEEADEDEDE